MDNNVMPSGLAYAYTILNKWDEIIDLGEEFRENYLENKMDLIITRKYISKLSRLWLELYPKLADRTEDDIKELSSNFAAYEVFYQDPKLLLNPNNADKLFKLEKYLRLALEKLKITRFEDIQV